jgi:thiosulfate/3-mercaptopyruvate sulfurtransferase
VGGAAAVAGILGRSRSGGGGLPFRSLDHTVVAMNTHLSRLVPSVPVTVVVVAFLAAPSGAVGQSPLPSSGLTAPEAAQPTHRIASGPGMLASADWVAAHEHDPSVVILQAETQKERFTQGHIPGARFLDMNALMWEGDPPVGAQMRTPEEIDAALEAAGVSDGQRVVVYSDSPLLEARAWTTLDVMGLGDRASVLDGGLGGWRQDGRPVSTDTSTVAPGSLTLHPRDGVVVDSDWIARHLDDASLTILDARTSEEYDGADNGSGNGGTEHHGHIPGAYSLPWEKFVDSRQIPRLHSREELAALMRASGAADGSTVAVYCLTGVRASFEYFVARLLGYDAKLYDGSWRDWGSKDLPYVTGTSRR